MKEESVHQNDKYMGQENQTSKKLKTRITKFHVNFLHLQIFTQSKKESHAANTFNLVGVDVGVGNHKLFLILLWPMAALVRRYKEP